MILVLLKQCYVTTFASLQPSINKYDGSMQVMLTSEGLSKYSQKNIAIAISEIQGTLQLPNISLKFSVFIIDLTNGQFSDLSIGNLIMNTHETSVLISMNNITMVIKFQLQITQQTFPYITDSGSLTISVQDFQIFTNGRVTYPDDESGIISEEIKNQLNGEMGQQIVKTLCDQLLKLLTQQSEVSKFNYDQNISTDQRYFDGITIKDNMLSVWFQGYKCDHSNTDSTCFGYSQTNISRRKTFYTNHDVQYQIEKYAFNSGFWLYLYQERIFNGIKIENITLKRFFNMGAQVIAQLDVNGTKDSLEFLEPVVFTRSAIPDHVYIGKFAIRLTNLIGNTILSQNQLASLSQYFDNRFSLYDISYTNALAVSETQVDYIYLDENWIHIGSNIE